MQTILKNTKYEVLTPDGFSDFDGLVINHDREVVLVDDTVCTPCHRFLVDGEWKTAESLDHIKLEEKQDVYDLMNVKLGNRYYTDDKVSHNCTDLYWDEAAFTNNDQIFWESNYPIVSSGRTSRIIVTSTPNGQKGVFYNLYRGGKEGTNTFKVIEVPYTRVPPYATEEFRIETIKNIGEDSFNQEYACSFASASGALISSSVQSTLRSVEPINIKQIVQSTDPILKIYEKPKANHNYVTVVDSSEGVGLDYSTFIIFDVTKLPYKVVATYRNNNIPIQLYPIEIVNASKMYNNSWILCEINNMGVSVASDIFNDFEYENIFKVGKNNNTGSQEIAFFANSALGLKTSSATKKLGCANVKTLIETGRLILNDAVLIDEFSTFVKVGNSYQADKECHDDMAMCCVIFAWLASQPNAEEMFKASFKHDMVEEYSGVDVFSRIIVVDGLDDNVVDLSDPYMEGF